MDSAITPIKFDIYRGGQLVRTEILTEPTIKIGKLTSSHVRIDDDSVSRMHAVVEVGPSGVVILDLGSASGTFVNGEKITKQSLKTGDRVQLGDVTVQVTIAGQLSPQASARVAQAPVQTGPLFDEEEDLGAGRTLEVLALWGPTVIDVRHLSDDEQYLIGDAPEANQFVNPKAIPQDPYPLAISDGASMVVNVPDGVDGDVMLDGKVYALEELKAAGKLGRAGVPQSHALRLPARARCRLKIGELTFLVNSVAAAPPVKRASFLTTLDPQLMRYLLAAGLLHALFFGIVMSIPEDADSLNMDAFNDADRFVEFMLQPEDEEEKLKDLFKDLKDTGEEAAEKAKDDEGKLGKKDSDQENKRFAVQGDQEEITVARERAKQEAINAADSAMNSLENELSAVWGQSDRAIGGDAVNALGNMFGDKVGEAAGFGGLGTAGMGRGGGGFGEGSIGVGGPGTLGRGGRGGKGGRGYGRGAARLGERKARKPKVIPGRPIITGSLDKETIRRVIRRHRNEYRYCYEKQLNRKRDLNGKIMVKFTISGNGSVIQSSILSSTMKDAQVERCIKNKVKRWVFPAPKGGGIVVVKYPFIFKPS